MSDSTLPMVYAGDSYLSHLVYGVGSTWSTANIVINGPTLLTMIGPVLLGVAAISQAWIAYCRLQMEKQRYVDERASRPGRQQP